MLIAGPCVIEDPDETLWIAERLAHIAAARGLGLVFKASFDKANRTRGDSYRGPGLGPGLAVLDRIRDRTGLPITTDVHHPEQAAAVAEVAALLQVPAFLCRQTDLVHACGATGRPVNIKKGQFVAPQDLGHAVDKCRRAGAPGVILTERGTTFGYHDLVVDMRALPRLAAHGVPVCFDATHSVQRPSARAGVSGGDRGLAPTLAAAAVAAGADAVFVEVHPDPTRARSDAATQLPLDLLPPLLDDWIAHRAIVLARRQSAAKP